MINFSHKINFWIDKCKFYKFFFKKRNLPEEPLLRLWFICFIFPRVPQKVTKETGRNVLVILSSAFMMFVLKLRHSWNCWKHKQNSPNFFKIESSVWLWTGAVTIQHFHSHVGIPRHQAGLIRMLISSFVLFRMFWLTSSFQIFSMEA